MSTIQFLDGKILFNSGQIGFGAGCCCKCIKTVITTSSGYVLPDMWAKRDLIAHYQCSFLDPSPPLTMRSPCFIKAGWGGNLQIEQKLISGTYYIYATVYSGLTYTDYHQWRKSYGSTPPEFNSLNGDVLTYYASYNPDCSMSGSTVTLTATSGTCPNCMFTACSEIANGVDVTDVDFTLTGGWVDDECSECNTITGTYVMPNNNDGPGAPCGWSYIESAFCQVTEGSASYDVGLYVAVWARVSYLDDCLVDINAGVQLKLGTPSHPGYGDDGSNDMARCTWSSTVSRCRPAWPITLTRDGCESFKYILSTYLCTGALGPSSLIVDKSP